MTEDEERLLRVTIGMLAQQLHELVTHVGAINAVLRESVEPGELRALLEAVDDDLRDLEGDVLRVAEAFPPEVSESGNGPRLH